MDFSPENWHKPFDGKGKTLVIIKTKDNFYFWRFYSREEQYAINSHLNQFQNLVVDMIFELYSYQPGYSNFENQEIYPLMEQMKLKVILNNKFIDEIDSKI
ncbi:hypothetical protein M0811_02322 [Anaeramoeba ignava]|uniref:Uncharacterized protein n=1 Tax=Anaeramoeba ignava TaxID=1746090 RepID=A0A9Q0LC75_ANAIG|nr:hypothetical protein M0811_02322 [Anaeramoeba ignava]